MRIFIGLTDVANITFNYAKGFKSLGHEVFSAVWSKSRFYPDSEYDLIIDERDHGVRSGNVFIEYFRILTRLVQLARGVKCDLFILYAPAVLPSHLYYPVLRLFGKKIISAFWGSDIRYWYAFAEEMKSFGAQDEISPFFEYARVRSGGSYWDKKRTIRVAERYSNLIISQPDCGQLQTHPYMRASVPLDLSKYRFNVPGRIKPLILHAPSVPEAKGTDIVLNVIKELEEEGLQFEFRLIENMPNAELRELLTTADIVVDELYSATVGGLSAEAMATGNVVLVRYMTEYCKVPEGCPAINVNKFTLKDNLRQAILDVDRRKKLASLGRSYVEANNDHIKICKDLLNWLEHADSLHYDFYPVFHENFQMPKQILMEERKETDKRRSDFFKTLLSTGTTKKKQEH